MLKAFHFLAIAILVSSSLAARASSVCNTLSECLQLRDQVNARIVQLENTASTCQFSYYGYYSEEYEFTLNAKNPELSVLNFKHTSPGYPEGKAQNFGMYTYKGKRYLNFNAASIDLLVPYPVVIGAIVVPQCTYDSLRGACGSYGNPYLDYLTKGTCK
ncbi:MAG: hypothetical protein ACAH59_07855 [Pseudobdellovibrionaceae bacterium]